MKTISVDLHGMTSEEAILNILKTCPGNVDEIEIIYGYNIGTVLSDMVRGLFHPRIERKIPEMNNGVAVYVEKSIKSSH